LRIYLAGGIMASIKRSIKINAPLSKVFDYVTKPENWTRYVTSLVDVRNLSDAEPKAGTSFEWTYRMLGINHEGKGKITEFERNKKFAMEMEGSFPIHESYHFEGDEKQAELMFEIQYNVPGKVLGVIANSLVIEKMNITEAVAVLNKIKTICEEV
jgi:ligand-binding SRPBCC domain-containing protein